MEIMENIRRERAEIIGYSVGHVCILVRLPSTHLLLSFLFSLLTPLQDMKGLGAGHAYKPALDVLKEIGEVDKNYYPEALRKMVFVNCPWIFNMLWGLVKIVYDPKTLKKTELISGDASEYLKQIIPLDELPADYGGKQVPPSSFAPS